MNRTAMTGVILCLAAAATAEAQETYYPAQDTWVQSNMPDVSNGGSVYLSAEEYPATSLTERIYLKFTIPDLVGKTVTAATLRLMCVRESGGGSTGDDLEVFGVNAAWNDTLTYTQSTTLPIGGMVVAVPSTNYSDTTNVVDPPQPVDFNITSLVQSWAAGVTNNGLMVRMAPGAQADLRFGSMEESLAAKWPVLTVTYSGSSTPPPPPPPPPSGSSSSRDNDNGDGLCHSSTAAAAPGGLALSAALALALVALAAKRS